MLKMMLQPVSALTDSERKILRSARVSKSYLSKIEPEQLNAKTGIIIERCQQLVVLAQFQTLSSVGAAAASDLWLLGFRSFDSLRNAEPSKMYLQFCHLTGEKVDPCVEDVFRCAVAQVRYPYLLPYYRQWWVWKSYRGKLLTEPPSDI